MSPVPKEGQFILQTLLGSAFCSFCDKVQNYFQGKMFHLYSLDSSGYSDCTPPPWWSFGPVKLFWLIAPLSHLVTKSQSFKLTTPSGTENSFKKCNFIPRSANVTSVSWVQHAHVCQPSQSVMLYAKEPPGEERQKIWQSNWIELFLVSSSRDRLYFTLEIFILYMWI